MVRSVLAQKLHLPHLEPIHQAMPHQWLVNGAGAGNGGRVFTTGSIKDGDVVTCALTTGGKCLVIPTVVSSPITVHVQALSPLNLYISPSVVNVCSGTPVSFTVYGINANSSTSYQWSVNQQLENVNSGSFTTNGLHDGDMIGCTVIDAEHCIAPSSATPVKVTIEAQPSVTFSINPVIKKGGNVQLAPTIAGNVISWEWSPADGLSNASVAAPVANPTVTTNYTLTVVTAAGCQNTGEVTVSVQDSVSPPNAFTPNGDGINDTWNIGSITDYPGCKVDIFNRYGQQVFHSMGYGKPWDGTNGSSPVPVGTYYYIINLNNGQRALTGYVAVIR